MDLLLISISLIRSGLKMAVPLLMTALGEVFAERAGVINIGLEGIMLTGAFFSVWGSWVSGSVLVGILWGLTAAVALAALFALLCVLLPCDQIVTGAGVNLFALGLTGFLFRRVLGAQTGFELPKVVPYFFEIILGVFSLLLLLFFTRTYFGLRLRMVGEVPVAATTIGISVYRVRFGAVLFGGLMAGLAGSYLSLAHSSAFTEGMTSGRGFMALAIVIFGRWHPLGVVLASLFFGLALALQYQWQALGSLLPYQLVRMMPYLFTLTMLAVLGQKKGGAPAALGEPFRN